MNSSAEEALRAAVHELAGEARAVPDLAAGALRRGRRVRAHRRAMVVAVSVLAVAAMILPFVLLRHRPPVLPAVPEPTVSATPGPDLLPTPGRDWTTSPLVLPGGWVVGSALRDGTGWVLDRSRNRYQRAAGYAGVWPAPRGAFSALVDANRPLEIGLGDTARGRTTWIRVGPGVGPLQWSPDGRRLVVTISDKDTGGRFIGVLSTDGGFRRYPVDTVRYFCTDHCFFTWTRDGREVALQQTDAFAPGPSRRGTPAGACSSSPPTTAGRPGSWPCPATRSARGPGRRTAGWWWCRARPNHCWWRLPPAGCSGPCRRQTPSSSPTTVSSTGVRTATGTTCSPIRPGGSWPGSPCRARWPPWTSPPPRAERAPAPPPPVRPAP